jgi:hypothetical protein
MAVVAALPVVQPHQIDARQGLTVHLPQLWQQVLASGLDSTVVDIAAGGGVVLREKLDWIPPQIPKYMREQLSEWIEAGQRVLTPWSPVLLGQAIGKLLAHFERSAGSDQRDPDLLEAMMVDWIEDLGEYPRWAVEDAAREYRRTEKKWKPTIAVMRELCEDRVKADRRTLRMLAKLRDAQI